MIESLYANYESLLKEVSDKEGLAISLLSDVPGKKASSYYLLFFHMI